MSKNPFEKYQDVEVSNKISEGILNSSNIKINPDLQRVILKYSFLFLCSLVLSLIVCPQRGVGLFRENYPLFHHILHQSEVLCGIYCGFVFFLTTHVLSFFLLDHFERLKVVKELSCLPIVFVSLFFGVSMTSSFSNLNLSSYYFTSWILVALTSYIALNTYYRRQYL